MTVLPLTQYTLSRLPDPFTKDLDKLTLSRDKSRTEHIRTGYQRHDHSTACYLHHNEITPHTWMDTQPCTLYSTDPGHRNRFFDPASKFLSTHWWSQNLACQRCFYKPFKNCHPASGFLKYRARNRPKKYFYIEISCWIFKQIWCWFFIRFYDFLRDFMFVYVILRWFSRFYVFLRHFMLEKFL